MSAKMADRMALVEASLANIAAHLAALVPAAPVVTPPPSTTIVNDTTETAIDSAAKAQAERKAASDAALAKANREHRQQTGNPSGEWRPRHETDANKVSWLVPDKDRDGKPKMQIADGIEKPVTRKLTTKCLAISRKRFGEFQAANPQIYLAILTESQRDAIKAAGIKVPMSAYKPHTTKDTDTRSYVGRAAAMIPDENGNVFTLAMPTDNYIQLDSAELLLKSEAEWDEYQSQRRDAQSRK